MAFFDDIATADLLLALFISNIIYTGWLAMYRLWLSPVAVFPGSVLAKLTFWYEFYYDWIKPGQYYKKIHEMHAKYGKSWTGRQDFVS